MWDTNGISKSKQCPNFLFLCIIIYRYWCQMADETWQPSLQEPLMVKDKDGRPQVSLGWASLCMWYFLLSVLWHCWLGDRKGIRPVKHWVLVCQWWQFDWSFARLTAAFVTNTSNCIILSSSKIQNRDILVPAYPGCPGIIISSYPVLVFKVLRMSRTPGYATPGNASHSFFMNSCPIRRILRAGYPSCSEHWS